MTLDTLHPFEQSFTVSPTQTPKADENYLLETFHQYPHGDFRPTFYNPFEIKHRRRTSRAQLKVLEKSYIDNPKPSAAIRRILAQKLDMTPRGVQIWFQNRRAKAKLSRKPSSSKITREEPAPLQVDEKQHCDRMNVVDSSLNNNDINQSSILFSHFFTNNFVQQEEEDWSVWHQLNENVRTVATTAAAVAAASSSSSSSSSSSYDMRRKSCPIMPPYHQINTMAALNQPQTSYISPTWSSHLLSMSPMQQQPFKRNFSCDTTSLEMMNPYSQHTPPLTESCSASTVAGSPISIDNLYMNDPVVLPIQYYNQHVSSPLSATTYITDYMPQFI